MYSEWFWPTALLTIQHFIFLEIFQVSGSNETPIPEVTKLRFFIDKLPFTLHLLVGLMHNSTTTKEQKKGLNTRIAIYEN